MLATSLFRTTYKYILKPILFKFDPEFIHNAFVWTGNKLGQFSIMRKFTSRLFKYSNPILEHEVLGINFPNPIGLAAGFDYDAKLINILPAVGFGHQTVGTITNKPYEGNPTPRLGRLEKSKSLLVNKGFKSGGMDAGIKNISSSKKTYPLGISIGSTNKTYPSFEEQVQDVVSGFKKAMDANLVDYYELNISCPNLVNISSDTETFSTLSGFRKLLQALSDLTFTKPVFVKMHLEMTEEETGRLLDIAGEFKFIKGFIFSNLCKDRSNPNFDQKEISKAGKGSFSGRPTFDASNKLISYAFKNYGDRFVIIGCGGVFSAEDAYEKIKLGASLVQLITGMIFEGPHLIGEINKGLVELLKEDGYKSISDAVGSAHR